MEKIEMRIIGLSQAPGNSENYVVVLEDLMEDKKVPIVIKESEAQFIALNHEGIKTSKIFVWDLIKKISKKYSFHIDEVFIHSVYEGVFYTKLITSSAGDEIELNLSASDAICISITTGCPIMLSKEVWDKFGFRIGEDGEVKTETKEKYKPIVTLESLEKMLEKALDNEEYEIASQIRDKIKSMKGEIE